MRSDVYNEGVKGTGSGTPNFVPQQNRIDFGTVKPSQWLSIPLILDNIGGNFSGSITATLRRGDGLFEVQFSSKDETASQVRLVVEFNTYIGKIEQLGKHSEVLEIQVGKQLITIYVDGVIIAHNA